MGMAMDGMDCSLLSPAPGSDSDRPQDAHRRRTRTGSCSASPSVANACAMPAHGSLWATLWLALWARRRGKLEARTGAPAPVDRMGAVALAPVSLLYSRAWVLPPPPPMPSGWARAGKRQSQSLLKPKLEFRGPKLARFPAFFDQKRPKLGVAP